MKCPNCGFTCDDRYCAMCGTKMPEPPVTQFVNNGANPFNPAPNSMPNPAPVNQNPINNTNFGESVNNSNPYIQTPTPFYGTNPAENDFQTDIPNAPQNDMPTPPVYSVPSQNGMPTPSAYPAPPQYTPTPKKKSKALPIILTCLISAVIVAGAAISVYSACTYNQSIVIGLIGESENRNVYSPNEYEPYYGEDINYIEDDEAHKIDEVKKLPDCKVTLKKAQRDKSGDTDGEGNSLVKVTFELENTTDKTVTFDYVSGEAYNGDTYYNWVNDNVSEDQTFELKPNEKRELTFGFAVPNKTDSFEVYLSLDNYDSNYSYYGYFITE